MDSHHTESFIKTNWAQNEEKYPTIFVKSHDIVLLPSIDIPFCVCILLLPEEENHLARRDQKNTKQNKKIENKMKIVTNTNGK